MKQNEINFMKNSLRIYILREKLGINWTPTTKKVGIYWIFRKNIHPCFSSLFTVLIYSNSKCTIISQVFPGNISILSTALLNFGV